jgi:phosphoglucomutase
LLNVAPALESITNHIFEMSKEISSYKICEGITVNLSSIGKEEWTVDNGNTFSVEVVDSVQDYLELMEEVFDFSKLKQFLTAENAPKILLNAMHGGM